MAGRAIPPDGAGPRRRLPRAARVVAPAMLMVVIIAAGLGWIGGRLMAPSGDGEDTVVFGDSVTHLASEEIAAAAGAEVVAFDGVRWADMVPAVELTLQLLPRTPRRVGVLIGSNDVLTLAIDEAQVDGVLDQLSDVDCVVVMELPKTFGGFHRQMNRRLRDAVAERPNMVTDDRWRVAADRNLEDEDGSLFEEDKIHPKPAGQQLLAEAYQGALDEHC
ncbi:MAG: SGNH/GDSL hydrolase family protein [Microthrixaceae bacterium]